MTSNLESTRNIGLCQPGVDEIKKVVSRQEEIITQLRLDVQTLKLQADKARNELAFENDKQDIKVRAIGHLVSISTLIWMSMVITSGLIDPVGLIPGATWDWVNPVKGFMGWTALTCFIVYVSM